MATTVYRYFGNEIEKIDQFNASFLYGDLIFSTFRAFGSLVPWWKHHIERLKCGASFLQVHPNWNLILHDLEDGKSKLVQHFHAHEWIGRPTLRKKENDLQLMFFAWEVPALQQSSQKLAVALSERKRVLPSEIKGGDYIIENQGKQWATEMGMDDILFWQGSEKKISETSSSNVFFVDDHEEILTPSTVDGNCLSGITRKQVIAMVKRLGLKVSEREICLTELGHFREAFLTNCGQFIRPVGQIDNSFFSSAHDNSLTNKLKKELNFCIHGSDV
ncbi:MAG: aminotransferase class IV [Bdellovibrio sp.]|nr:aminotransferase class IV [Bdellovibrio sp.]